MTLYDELGLKAAEDQSQCPLSRYYTQVIELGIVAGYGGDIEHAE